VEPYRQADKLHYMLTDLDTDRQTHLLVASHVAPMTSSEIIKNYLLNTTHLLPISAPSFTAKHLPRCAQAIIWAPLLPSMNLVHLYITGLYSTVCMYEHALLGCSALHCTALCRTLLFDQHRLVVHRVWTSLHNQSASHFRTKYARSL